MKRLLLIGVAILFLNNHSSAQTSETNMPKKIINQGYYEFNFGVAFLSEVGVPFPGISFLIGNKTYFRNNMILDAELGLALPSIATAKIGVGYRGRSGEVIVGVRPWPTHFYLQTQLNNSDKGGWIMSVEVSAYSFSRIGNPFNDAALEASMYSLGILNFGYRWNIRK